MVEGTILTKERNSNIELLRLLLMVMVILLHFNNEAIGGAFTLVTNNPASSFTLHFFESLSIGAVNCFMIISGFFLYTNTKIKFGKVLDILLIVVFYSYLDYFLQVVFGGKSISIKYLLAPFFIHNYFALFYVICYILSPFIASIWKNLAERKADFLIVILVVLFIVIPTIIDIVNDLHIINTWWNLTPLSTHGSGEGYTIVQFVICLSIGMWIRKRQLNIKSVLLLLVFVLSSLVITMGIQKMPSLYNYCSFLTVLNAICLFMLFQKISIQSRIINYAAKSCFAIFCIHVMEYANGLWRQYFITEEHLSKGTTPTIFWTIVSVTVMFFCCLMLGILMRFVLGKIKEKCCNKLPVVYCY